MGQRSSGASFACKGWSYLTNPGDDQPSPLAAPMPAKAFVSFECLAERKSSDCGQTVERGDGTQTVAFGRLEAELGASEAFGVGLSQARDCDSEVFRDPKTWRMSKPRTVRTPLCGQEQLVILEAVGKLKILKQKCAGTLRAKLRGT